MRGIANESGKSEVIDMDQGRPYPWVFELYREHLEKECRTSGEPVTDDNLNKAFQENLCHGSLKILVQEPWMGTIRFKALAGHSLASPEAELLYANPLDYLLARYGGGKFKVNFYRGMHFVATKNFKPQGEPRWTELPEWVEA